MRQDLCHMLKKASSIMKKSDQHCGYYQCSIEQLIDNMKELKWGFDQGPEMAQKKLEEFFGVYEVDGNIPESAG